MLWMGGGIELLQFPLEHLETEMLLINQLFLHTPTQPD